MQIVLRFYEINVIFFFVFCFFGVGNMRFQNMKLLIFNLLKQRFLSPPEDLLVSGSFQRDT